MRRDDLRQLRKAFPRVEVRGSQLLSMARRLLPAGRIVAMTALLENIRIPEPQRSEAARR